MGICLFALLDVLDVDDVRIELLCWLQVLGRRSRGVKVMLLLFPSDSVPRFPIIAGDVAGLLFDVRFELHGRMREVSSRAIHDGLAVAGRAVGRRRRCYKK